MAWNQPKLRKCKCGNDITYTISYKINGEVMCSECFKSKK